MWRLRMCIWTVAMWVRLDGWRALLGVPHYLPLWALWIARGDA